MSTSANREGCWCANARKPCSYHEGWEDGYEVAARERDATLQQLEKRYNQVLEHNVAQCDRLERLLPDDPDYPGANGWLRLTRYLDSLEKP